MQFLSKQPLIQLPFLISFLSIFICFFAYNLHKQLRFAARKPPNHVNVIAFDCYLFVVVLALCCNKYFFEVSKVNQNNMRQDLPIFSVHCQTFFIFATQSAVFRTKTYQKRDEKRKKRQKTLTN